MTEATPGAVHASRSACPSVLRLAVALTLAAASGAAAATPGAAESRPRNILILYAYPRLLPANVDFDRGFREVVGAAERPVQVYDEFLDAPRFSGARFEALQVAVLREKYVTARPSAIVAAGTEALAFLLAHRAELFPDAPIVHAGTFESFVDERAPLPADVLGVPLGDDFATTIDLALRWHPTASRLVIVTGTSSWDRRFEARLREATPRLAPRVPAEFLAGLPAAAVRARLAALGPDSVVFTPGFFRDGDGREFLPRESARIMAEVATAPIYGPFVTFVGSGVVGGYMPDFVAIGRQTGDVALSLLEGADVAGLRRRLPARSPETLHVDWRQARRWGIPEAAVPADAVVHFRAETFLQQHGRKVAAALLAFLVQTGLVAVLLVERQRRRSAERESHRHRMELAHASRVAVVGELTGSIAHQINQPLGAILANAEAGELLLESGEAPREKLKGILADIRRDDLRASEVILRLRGLLARQEVSFGSVDVGEVVEEIEVLLRAEAKRRRVGLEVKLPSSRVRVRGDRLQLQQVLVNLVVNAMEVVSDLPDARRTLAISVEPGADDVVVSVSDRGPGIAPQDLPRVFDSFFTTKAGGMGLGLPIARTLVEGMDGEIRVESRSGDGATFRVRLPLLRPPAAAAGGAP